MSIVIVDTHTSHAAVVRLLLSLGSFDILYYSDTRCAPLDELSAFTRVSRLLTLLGTHTRERPSTAVLLGRGMSSPPREAVDLGARRAGIELIHAVDLIAERAGSVLSSGGLCLVGDSCLTEIDVRSLLDCGEVLEVRWSRVSPMYRGDEPLRGILKDWEQTVGVYVLATPDNKRVAAQIRREDPTAAVIDEYEHLALTLAERLPEASAPRLRVHVTERTSVIVARLKSLLGSGTEVIEFGRPEPAPTDGPFATSLDADGLPA